LKQILIRNGQPVVEDVPRPQAERGTVVVRASFSCVSPGTELSSIRASATPLWKRALREPANVGKVLAMVRERGLSAASNVVRSKVDRAFATGYSMAGIVQTVGEGIFDLAPGDRVACAGAQYALHAEIVRVPRNLVVPVPKDVTLESACTVTLGAIALQGVRRFQPTLGETCIVIGLGLIGQLTAQLLKASGCAVIGVDIDPMRVAVALEAGARAAFVPDSDREIEQVMRLTDGHGADGVIVTAASESDALISSAFRMCRRKGRVVLVGDVGLNLKRADIYEKELDFLVSTSYGPGRYDSAYEEEGLDYPIGYVRWTENRNMSAYLDLLAAGRVRIDTLLSNTFSLEAVREAYRIIEARHALGALLRYPEQAKDDPARVLNPVVKSTKAGALRLAIVGAGSFAKTAHLPLLRSLSDRYSIDAVVSRSGPNAQETARQAGARYATTNFQDVLQDSSIDAVLIATRHHLHCSMALEALAAGKHVLLEKPMAMTRGELDEIKTFFARQATTPVLLTGYNRRFSPPVAHIGKLIEARSNPVMLAYRMNAGRLARDHWTFGQEGGGRNIGEACHIYDLFTALTRSEVRDVETLTLIPATSYYRRDDNFVATIRFKDGSVASLTYTAMGSEIFPKETMEVFCDGRVITLNDYREVQVHGEPGEAYRAKTQEKGLREELAAFHQAALGFTEWPIPLWQQLQAADIALRVEDRMRANRTEPASAEDKVT
jgi:predicted dehydrogenase/threonine dehydrogenase-like Zn-dependent dehydrogenase